MSDISNLLIKDSYDYVIQVDPINNYVYRIGGGIPTNPIFVSGLTTYTSFKFSNGTEQENYVLTSDSQGNATWKAISGATVGASGSSGSSGTSGTGFNTVQNPALTRVLTSDGTPNGAIAQSGLTFSASSFYVEGLTNTIGITSTGGITFPQKTITSSYTATTNDYLIDAVSGTFNVYLPSAIGIQGKLYVVKNNGGGAVTVQPILGQTIDDKPFLILSETNSVQLASNGSQWVSLSQDRSTVNNSTGVFQFSGLSKVSATQFAVGRTKGWIVDDTTNPLSPQILYVDYSGGTHTDNYVTTAFETFVYLTSSGTIGQKSTILTEQERRQNIFLGKIGHPDKTQINLVFNQPDFVLSPLAQLRDVFTPINLINGGVYPSANGVNLNFNTSNGYLYGLGINFVNSTLNPNAILVPATSPCTFQYRTQTGGSITNITLIDPNNYDNGGVITPIGGGANSSTNQRIYLLQNGTFRVQYGQTVYSTLSDAIAGIQTEQFTTFPNFINNAILIGILSVTKNTLSLSDTTKARFLFVSKFGETVGAAGGISTTNLQQAYNNSGNPEILTDTTRGAVTFKNGQVSDANNVIEVQSYADGNVFAVNGSGRTTTSYLTIGNIIEVSGYTKYLVVDNSGNTFFQTGAVGTGSAGSSGTSGTSGSSGTSGVNGAGGALGYYGSFYSTQDQILGAIDSPSAMTLNVTAEANGISVVNNSRITFANPGTYDLQFSAQLHNTGGGGAGDIVTIWLRRNGQNVIDSSTNVTVSTNNPYTVAAWDFLFTITGASEYVELIWSTNNTSLILENLTGSTIYPNVPSLIVTAMQVMYTQVGLSGSSGTSGTSGTRGSSGSSGSSGTSGTRGSSGSSGTSGTNGTNGTSGKSCLSVTVTNIGPSPASFDYIDCDFNGITLSFSIGETKTFCYTTLPTLDPARWTVTNNGACRGTSGTSGTNGTNGTSGTNGTNGTSGTSGREGSIGPSGTNGTSGSSNGTSGTSGTRGSSGSSGTSGTSGIGVSGTNGTSGSSNGTSGTSGINGTFNGSVLITNGSIYIEPFLTDTYYFGNSIYGWNDTIWDATSPSLIARIDLQSTSNYSCLIPLQIDILSGSTITLCGLVYADGGSTGCDFYGQVGTISCSDIDSSILRSSNNISSFTTFSSLPICFNFNNMIQTDLLKCNDFFVIGFGITDPGNTISNVKISYTLSVTPI